MGCDKVTKSKLKKQDKRYDFNTISNNWRKNKTILEINTRDGTYNGILIDFDTYNITILPLLDLNKIDYDSLSPMLIFKHSITSMRKHIDGKQV